MQDVTITFTDGPLRGRSVELEVDESGVTIGRLPGPGGLELKGSDGSVSREHARLLATAGDVELENLSPNGTTVNDKLILDRTEVKPGAHIRIGDHITLEAHWRSFKDELQQPGVADNKASVVSQGPLSSPIVRLVLAVYLLGILGAGIWFTLQSTDTSIPDEWPDLNAAYETYAPVGLSDTDREARLTRAEKLVEEIRVLRIRGMLEDIPRICREMMNLDKDTDSPLFTYGAQCLGTY